MRRLLACAFVAIALTGQIAAANSIFSYHPRGLGIWAWPGEGRIMGMGGTQIAVYGISNPLGLNPSTLAAFDRTALAASVLSESRAVRDRAGLSGRFYSQYPRDLRVVAPVGYGVVASVGLEPLSDVRIIWSRKGETAGLSYRDSLDASGGLWAGTAAVGRKVGPVALGLRMHLVRGTITTEWRRTISENLLATSTLVRREFSGAAFTLGATWPKERWALGASLDLPAELDERNTSSIGTRIPSAAYPSHDDILYTGVTADLNDTTATSADLPLGAAVGASWRSGERVTAAFDLGYRRWSTLSDDFRDTWHAGIGTEILPSTDFRSLFPLRWLWRAGLRWEQHYIPAPEAPTAWFVTGGVGIPIGQDIGRIDYAIEYGQRGGLDDQIARERIWRHTISIVGWERWFVRRTRR